MKKLVAILLCAITTAVFASDTYWIRTSQEPASVVFYVDINSIRTEGELKRAWILLDFPKSRSKARKKPGKTSGSMQMLQYFDCAANKLGTAQIAFYAENMGRGTSRHATRRDTSPEFTSAVPGSPEQHSLNFVCAHAAQ